MRLRIPFPSLLPAAGIALGLGAMAFGGHLVWRFVNPPETPTLVAEPEAGCDLHRGPCAAALPGGGRLTLAITPRPIPLIEPLALEVRVAGAAARSVEMDFSSPDMYMGYNRRALEPAGTGVYAARAVLPVCTRTRMTWRAQVVAHTEHGRVSVPFTFVTDPAAGTRS